MWSYISQFGPEHLYGVISIDQTPKMITDESWPYGMTGLNRETRPTFFDAPLPKPNKKSLNMFLIGVLLRGKKYLNFASAGAVLSYWVTAASTPELMLYAQAEMPLGRAAPGADVERTMNRRASDFMT